MSRTAGRFTRAESRRRAGKLVLGLLSDLPRKNCWTIAEWAGDGTPDGVQHLLGRAKWDADQVRDEVGDYVVEHLHDDEAVLVVDETGDVKKAPTPLESSGSTPALRAGSRTPRSPSAWTTPAAAGTPQWTGLYVPRSWTSDPDRCRDAGLGDNTELATKPELAARMVTRCGSTLRPPRRCPGPRHGSAHHPDNRHVPRRTPRSPYREIPDATDRPAVAPVGRSARRAPSGTTHVESGARSRRTRRTDRVSESREDRARIVGASRLRPRTDSTADGRPPCRLAPRPRSPGTRADQPLGHTVECLLSAGGGRPVE